MNRRTFQNATAIVIFTYSRLDHTRRTVDALLKNGDCIYHDLIIYSDAARDAMTEPLVQSVRNYLKTITGFRTITIHQRSRNYGLAQSIIEGVTEVLSRYERIIVLEDDIVTSPHFLAYMNEALERFAEDERVVSIHGYVYPIQEALPEAFFLRGADCWGWATWRRGWKLFNPNGNALLSELRWRNLIKTFDFNGAYGYSDMLEGQIKGSNDSWAIRWYASAFLADKLTLYPGRSLVHNIGNDSSGTHCGNNTTYDAVLGSTPINLDGIEVKHSKLGYSAFERFLLQSKSSLLSRIGYGLKRAFNKVCA